MKSTLLAIAILFMSATCMAQGKMMFPFQGGIDVMSRFFKDSLVVSQDIIQKKATGVAVFKFTADESGTIKKIIIYYADDYVLTPPIIEALKKSNHKWIIPDQEKLHDFIISFVINFNAPAAVSEEVQKDIYSFYQKRRPIITYNQIPIETATLLPAVQVNYNLP